MQVGLDGFLARLQLAAEQFAEALKRDRAILKFLAGRELRLGNAHCFPIAGNITSFPARDGLRATWAYRSLVARNLVMQFVEESTDLMKEKVS